MNRRCKLACLLLLLLCVFDPAMAQNASEKKPAAGTTAAPDARPEAEPALPQIELSNRWIDISKKSIELSQSFQEKIGELLKAADGYEVENYRKADDELSELYEKLDANYLEQGMIAEALAQSDAERLNARQTLESTAAFLKTSKMFSNKSSAIFYLCFGLPYQSQHYSRLAISLAESSSDPKAKVNLSSLYFYSGAASFWSAEYEAAALQLKNAQNLNANERYVPYYLGELYIAEKQNAKAIDWLNTAKQKITDDELRGSLNRSLALAYTLSKQTGLARKCIDEAKRQLSVDTKKEFPLIAKESIGVVTALSGDYRQAEKILSEAILGLQSSPVKLGMRLEAAQSCLWRSYCKHKLGDKAGAVQDRQYALSFTEEAGHLLTLAHTLDPLFGYKETSVPVGQIRDKWALVVGIGSFADLAVPKLRYPPKDAQDMEHFLIKSAGFKPDHVKLLLNEDATRESIVDCLGGNWLQSLVRPGDLVYLFISSHGTPAYKDIGALNAIVTYDTRLDRLFTSSLPMQSLVRKMRSNLKKQHSFVVLDTCYAGGLGAPFEAGKRDSNLDPELHVISKRQLMVSSSDSTERSWESKRYKNSIFTRQLIDSLEKKPDYADFRVIFDDISEKVNQEVSTDFKHTQTPRLAGFWNGKGLMSISRKLAGQELK